jgi:hypothetical protein
LSTDNRVRTAGFVVVSGALILVASVRGWHVVSGLEWPFDSDHFRNIANAVTFRDGGVFTDAHYAGVTAWYSPLTSALLAVGSIITFVPIHRLGAQAGVVLNLVTPISLVGVTARWFGRRVALATLVAYLFVIGNNYPPWAVASYSPWLFVNVYATGLFIIALAALPAAVNRGSIKDALLLGIAAGVVVLAHPANAILLAIVTAVLFLGACWHADRSTLRRIARSAGISLLSTLIVSAPFWLPIMIRYQWQVVNSRAGTFSWPELDSSQFWSFVREFVWRWPMLVMAVGLPLWVLRRRWPRRSGRLRVDGVSILTTWTVAALILMLLEVYRGADVVSLVPLPDSPSHHYLLALSVALCIWFGLALDAIVRAVLRRHDRQWGAVAVVVVVAVIAIATVPSWRNRIDLSGGRAEAEAMNGRLDSFRVVDWIRRHTEPDERFLNVGPGTWNGVLLPGLAGRKSVDINIPEYSNPFVSYTERQDAALRMVDALRACDLGRFRRVARRYGRVRFVITQAGPGVDSSCPDILPVVYRDQAVTIQRIAARGA